MVDRGARKEPWKPSTPLQVTIMGQVILGIPEAIALGILVAVWSTLTKSGLDFNQVTGIAILTVLVRKTVDTIMMRLIMRARHSPDYKGAAATAISFTFTPVAAVTSILFTPITSTTLFLISIVCLFFIVVICTIEKPWNTSVGYDELKERGRKVRLMTREHFAEEIAEGRISLRPIDDEGYYLDEDGNRIEE